MGYLECVFVLFYLSDSLLGVLNRVSWKSLVLFSLLDAQFGFCGVFCFVYILIIALFYGYSKWGILDVVGFVLFTGCSEGCSKRFLGCPWFCFTCWALFCFVYIYLMFYLLGTLSGIS